MVLLNNEGEPDWNVVRICLSLQVHETELYASETQANALALVDCVQDTYSNVAALIDDSVYNMEGGAEQDLERMVLDLSRVDRKVTTIVTGVRSLSMTFKVCRIKIMWHWGLDKRQEPSNAQLEILVSAFSNSRPKTN